MDIHHDLAENIKHIRETMGNSADLVVRKILLDPEARIPAAIIFIDGLIDVQFVQDLMVSLMKKFPPQVESRLKVSPELLQVLEDSIIAVSETQEVHQFADLFSSLFSGRVMLLIDELSTGISIEMQGWKQRSVSEPSTETIIRGPRESFNENIRTNTALIRRKIKSTNLRLESRKIGKETQTEVSIMYIKDIANEKIVEEARRRLNRIEIDGILESGYIEEMIQDETFTPFPTVFNTERPDVVAAELLEGRIAILIDGTPFVLIVPTNFIQYFQAAEDFYQRFDISSFLRILRFISFFIALLGPSAYVAITTFHQEMLPTPLLISLTAQREGVPFPAFVEAVLMEVAFEILREAGIRMPRAVGQAISIVGTLVIGTAAVEAGIVSAAMVIVVSITAISSFVFPASAMSAAIRMLRFPLMVLAASFGLFGIILGIIVLVFHLCSLRSFGIPFMAPFAPMVTKDLKDTLIRIPRWAMRTRPRLLNQKNIVREQLDPPRKPKPRT